MHPVYRMPVFLHIPLFPKEIGGGRAVFSPSAPGRPDPLYLVVFLLPLRERRPAAAGLPAPFGLSAPFPARILRPGRFPAAAGCGI